MAEKEGKYPCQYCNKPCRNPQSKKAHERACPKNPNRRVAKTGGKEGTQVEFNAETSPKLETEKEIPKEPELSEKQKKDIAETDAILSNLPSMRDLRGIVTRTAQDVDQHGREIAGINAKLGTIAGAIDAMASRRVETPGTDSKGTGPKKAVNIQEALDASLEADKEERGSASAATSGSKMDDLRKETKEDPSKDETGQVQGGPDASTLAALREAGAMPEGMQKFMMYATLAERLVPLLQVLRGESPQTAQTPEDQKAMQRSFETVNQVFGQALRTVDGVMKQARTMVWDEIKSNWNLVPKAAPPLPPAETEQSEGLE